MILPDINLLLHAYNAGSPQHLAARAWWERALNGEELVGLPWVVVLGFVRLSTNRHVFGEPFSVDEAASIAEDWLSLSNVRVLHPTGTHATVLFDLLRHAGTAGNLTTDAHLAALALDMNASSTVPTPTFNDSPG